MNYLIFLYRTRTLSDTRRPNKLALSIVLKEAMPTIGFEWFFGS